MLPLLLLLAVPLLGTATTVVAVGAAIASTSEDDNDKNELAKSEEQERRKAIRLQKETECTQVREDTVRRLKNLAAFIKENDIQIPFEDIEEWIETKLPDDFSHSISQHIDSGLDQLPLNERCGNTSYPAAWERFYKMDMLRRKLSHFAENMDSAFDYR